MSEFNLLKDAYLITNTAICRYDTLSGYISDFSTNGNIGGWDIYSGICMYGSWNSVLFGTTTEKVCFLGRTNPINPVPAENYYIFKLTMKITLPENYGKKTPPTKGKLQWQTASNQVWLDSYTKEFDLNLTDQWYTYIVNLGEAKNWIGDITQLRIYPIVDGFENIKFMIKSIRVDSINVFTCLNTQCSYHLQYTHPCPGMGIRASIKSGIPIKSYSTVYGESDVLILNIDDYGDEHIHLGTNSNLSGLEMSKILLDGISRVNIGQYSYVEVCYIEEEEKLVISSGSLSDGASIKIAGSAAKALGFLDECNDDVSEYIQGTSPATGFDYGSSRRLKGFEINGLIDSNTTDVVYYHDPNQYSVEAGRRDFADSMSTTFSATADKVDYYDLIEAAQKIVIDASHPINDSGKLNKIWINGNYVSNQGTDSSITPKVYIIRPNKSGFAKVIHELEISVEDPEFRYTTDHVTFRVDCDLLVSKGDLVGFYNLQVLAPFSSKTQTPNTVYFQIECGADGPGNDYFYLGSPKSKGVVGLSFYARSDRLQSNIQLDIDIGERTNIEELFLYGSELKNYFEYNIACCLDVNWTVDCHSATHWHKVDSRCAVTTTLVYVEHLNIPYGVSCLSDCVTTADGGQVGTSYITRSMGPTESNGGFGSVANSDPGYYSGIETYGEHSYCYVNGDAEWLNGGCCMGDGCSAKNIVQAEFKDPWVADVYDYEFDPISYYLIFPDNKWLDVHKTIMYFKESQNFKRYSLSYYLGESGEQGNAEEVHFNYVPSYNAVTLDGIRIDAYQSDGTSLTQSYMETLFVNPVPWAIPEYQNDVCINWDIYQTVMNTEVNVLQHDFDSINCRGFQIRTTWHRSTKLTELELYSQISVEPSLIDNISIQTSVYGDYWNELVFLDDVSNNERIMAYVPNSPRYFRLQIQSQDIFELREINAKISETHIKSLDCTNTLLPDIAPKYTYSTPKKLEIENIYDIPLDLLIEIPRQLFKEKQVLSWIRFDSEETTSNGEIGPGAVVRKSEDYNLYLNNGQIAINTPSYYLKNLIDGKKAFIYENEHRWCEYKTLYHGESADYTNEISGKVISFTFLPISTRFWKLSIHEPKAIDIKNLKLFYTQDSAIIPASASVDSFSYYLNGEHLPGALWSQNFTVDGGYFNIYSDSGYKYERSKFFIQGDFEIVLRWRLDNCDVYADRNSDVPILLVRSVSDLNRRVGMLFDYGYTDDTYYHTSNQRVTTYWTDLANVYTTGLRDYVSMNGDKWVDFKMSRVGNTFKTFYREIIQTYNEDLISYTDSYTLEYPGEFGDKVFVELAVNADSIYTGNTISVNFSKLLINGTTFIGDFDTNYVAENPVVIDKIHIQADPREGSGKYVTTFNNVENVINPTTLIEDDFSDGVWYDKWIAHTGIASSNTFVEKNSTLYPYMEPGEMIYIEKEFLPGAVSFDAEVCFNFEFPTTITYAIEFLSPDNEVSFRFLMYGYGNNTALLSIETIIPPNQAILYEYKRNETPFCYNHATFTKSSSEYVDGFKFKCKKIYNTYEYIKLTNTSESSIFYDGTNKVSNWDRISKIRITYYNTSTNDIKDQLKNYGTTYVRFSALPILSDYESVVFEFKDSTPIDTIKLVHHSGDISYPIIRISDYDSNDYRIWAKNFNITGPVSVAQSAIWGDNAYASASWNNSAGDLPSFAFTYTYDTSFQSGPEHHCIYDFGAGNSKVIQRIYYKSRYEDMGYDSSGENIWKRCQIYGTNIYDTFHVYINHYTIIEKFDFTNATFLKEFTISHNASETAYNIVDFENKTPFRYLVLYWPERSYVESDPYGSFSVELKWVQFYEKFEEAAPSGMILYNSNYTNYLAIDLEKPHNLDFIRNYGSKSNLLELFHEQSYLDYSNSDTSDINEVKWYDDSPTLLFNFDNKSESVVIDRPVYNNNYIKYGLTAGPIDGGHAWVGPCITTMYGGEVTGSNTNLSGELFISAQKSFDAVNMSLHTKTNSKLVVELKVENPSNIKWGQWEFSSYKSNYDIHEWAYDFLADPLSFKSSVTSEYTKFEWPLSYFIETHAPPDMSTICRIRFWITTINGPNTIGFKNARLQYIDEDSYIYITYINNMALKAYNFTMDFWLKRYRENINEGVLGQTSSHSTLSSFSVTYDEYDYLIITFYVGGTIYELKSSLPQVDKSWHHIAIVRNGAYLSLYIDGKIQNSTAIGVGVEINECVENFYIGKVDSWNFWGYIDEFRLLLGKAEWVSNFDVPTQSYSIGGQAGDPTSARWVKISLLCGDGVTRNIDKLGIYPDIRYPYIPTGGYNCEWLPLCDRLSNYKTITRNLSPKATVLGNEVIEDSFDSGLVYWDNTTNLVNVSIISQTDFGGDNPHDFWESSWVALADITSSYFYQDNTLSIRLTAAESGALGFYTDWFEGELMCEVLFNHSTYSLTDRLQTILRLHCEDGNYQDISIYQQSGVQYCSTTWDSINTVSSAYVPLIEGFKIIRYMGSVKLYKYVGNSWILQAEYINLSSLAGGAVRFEFLLDPSVNYPEVIVDLKSLKIMHLTADTSQSEWGLVDSIYGVSALGYKTIEVPISDGPIFRHPLLVGGVKVQYVEFYYFNSGSGGGGISFVDSGGVEVLGVATLSPSWAILSASGWEIVNNSVLSGNTSWYRVKVTFDWSSAVVNIEWEDVDASITHSYVKTLITTSNVAELHIKSTYGLSWGTDFIDIKFDNLVISPTASFISTFEPGNCLTGDSTLQGYNNCWGFPASITEPTLLIDLGELQYVDKFVMYSRPYDDSYDYIVNDFDIYGATSISGTFDLLVSEVGFTESFNSSGQNTYNLENPVEVRIIKLVIVAYSKPDVPEVYSIENRDGTVQNFTLDGGFVREFEIWSSSSSAMINSEDHPIICMDLLDQFNLTYHNIEGPGKDLGTGKLRDWSNENEFYQFSSDTVSNPNQVAFSDGYDYTVSFSYSDEFMVDDGGKGIYTVETDVFFLSGQYEITWETYSAQEVGGILLILTGLESKELPCKYTGTSWNQQDDTFSLSQSGYYHIQVKSVIDGSMNSWGVRNIFFKNFNYTSRWVALRRNTAENFAWDEGTYAEDIDNTPGIDYLKYLKLFASGNHMPTEYYWMWEATLSSFSNDSINTVIGKRSLKIEYPESDQMDFISYLEGDHFGNDENWSIKDSLSLWCYIEDIAKLSLSDGGFVFGSAYGYFVDAIEGNITDNLEGSSSIPSAEPALYIWKFDSLDLKSGWNYIRLRFDEHIETIPDASSSSDKLEDALNFKNHITSSFGMAVRGKGSSFYILLDGLKIERNWFYDEVIYGDNGLCLTYNDYAEIPLAGIDTRYGTFEAWIKLYTDTTGNDHFNNTSSRTLFTLVDSYNNSISLSIRSSSWFEVGVGDTKSGYMTLFVDPKMYDVGEASFNIDDIIHLAVVWSNDGTKIGDGDSIRLYVNGKLYLSGQVTWESGDSKNTILRLGGGNTYLATNDDSDGSAIFSNVKFYNYCKTFFETMQQIPSDIINLTPNDFIQVSSNGVEFLNSRDDGLPFEYAQVQPGEKIPVYIRVDKSRIDELDKFTGSINVEWKIPV